MPGFTSAQLEELIKLESYYYKNSSRNRQSHEAEKQHEEIIRFIIRNIKNKDDALQERHQSNIRCQIQRYLRYLNQVKTQRKSISSTLTAYSNKETFLQVLANLFSLLAFFKAPEDEKQTIFADVIHRSEHRTMRTVIATIADDKVPIVPRLEIKDTLIKEIASLKSELLKNLNLPDYNCAIHVFGVVQKSMNGLYQEISKSNPPQMWKILLCLALEYQELADRLHYDSLLVKYLPEIEDFKSNLITLFQETLSPAGNNRNSEIGKDLLHHFEKNSNRPPEKENQRYDFSNLKNLFNDNPDHFFNDTAPIKQVIDAFFKKILDHTKQYSHLCSHYSELFEQLCLLHSKLIFCEVEMFLNRCEQQHYLLSKFSITKLLEREVQVLVALSKTYEKLASIHSTSTPFDKQSQNLFSGKASISLLQATLQQKASNSSALTNSAQPVVLLPLKNLSLLLNRVEQLQKTEPGNVQLYRAVLKHHLEQLQEPDFVKTLTTPERITHFESLVKLTAMLASSYQFSLFHNKKAAKFYFEEYNRHISESYKYFNNSKTRVERQVVLLKHVHLPKIILESDFVKCCSLFHKKFMKALAPLNPLLLIESLDAFCQELSMIFSITDFNRLLSTFENIIAQYLLYSEVNIIEWHESMSSVGMQNFRADLNIYFNSTKEFSPVIDNQATKQTVNLCLKNTNQLLTILANQLTKHLINKNYIPEQELTGNNRLLFREHENLSRNMRTALETIALNNDQTRFHFLRPQPKIEKSTIAASNLVSSKGLRTQSDSTFPQMLRRSQSEHSEHILSYRQTVELQEAQERLKREQSEGFVDVDLNS